MIDANGKMPGNPTRNIVNFVLYKQCAGDFHTRTLILGNYKKISDFIQDE